MAGRSGVDTARISGALENVLRYRLGVTSSRPSAAQVLWTLSAVVRDTLVDRRAETEAAQAAAPDKAVHFVCMEYLLGRLLRGNLQALGLEAEATEAVARLGFDLADIAEEEPDPSLGNGGLGRLAACLLDSLATLEIPSWGYGLRYESGTFQQHFEDGWQEERADCWLELGTPWEICRPELRVAVPLGGRVEWSADGASEARPKWVGWRTVWGVPYDVLIAGFGCRTAGVLRLWRAVAPQLFDFEAFARGDFHGALAQRDEAESITKVLYPADNLGTGRDLRLMQEYFLAACSVRDVIRRFRAQVGDRFERFAEHAFFQLNDTHPALVVAELMRVLVDEAGVGWDQAWDITRASCGYTCHTLLPGALETWSVPLIERLLPRHGEIVLEINRRFLDGEVAARYPGDGERRRRLSLVHENGEQSFAMAHLAVVGSRRINGVSRLHSEALRQHVFGDFADLWPERFISITNGITPRRWLLGCNPDLAGLIDKAIGTGWERDLERLGELLAWAEEPEFVDRFMAVKSANKQRLAAAIAASLEISVDPAALFDVHVKRLHLYKRQLLNALHIATRYLRIKAGRAQAGPPRVFIFAAKAAPAYRPAKLVIKLINEMASAINGDSAAHGRLAVAFLPDYRVSLAERVIPAADLSEQISTAGTEASGTGGMKLALNGALTIGTLDGANIEIIDAVGGANMFTFGLTAVEVAGLRDSRGYDPREIVAKNEELAEVLAALRSGLLDGGSGVGRDLARLLLDPDDPFLHLADYSAYLEAQSRVAVAFADPRHWAAMAIRNVAGMGYFSSDRAVREYAEEVWDVRPRPVGGATSG